MNIVSHLILNTCFYTERLKKKHEFISSSDVSYLPLLFLYNFHIKASLWLRIYILLLYDFHLSDSLYFYDLEV